MPNTAMQELIEFFTFYSGNYTSREEILVKTNDLIEKEKQQIKQAFNFANQDKNPSNPDWAEDYYNETFKP